MKKILEEKRKLITCILIVIITLATIGGIYIYKSNVNEKEIKQLTARITSVYDDFEKTENRNDKLKELKSLNQEFDEYKKTDKSVKEVVICYEDNLTKMKKYFTDEYNKIIGENTLENSDKEEDKNKITVAKNNLVSLLETIKKETGIVCSKKESETYVNRLSEEISSYTERLKKIEEKEKAAIEQKEKEEKAKAHYENEFFSVDVPSDWIGSWSVTEEDHSPDGFKYIFSYKGDNNIMAPSGGGAEIYVVDATYGLPQNGKLISSECTIVGYTSNNFAVFMTEAGAGFFSHGATINLK
ncbi:hypothetical protein [Holdemanella biformis]|uniref:hypothetical protein n=1 Tax=Holdemanella biformis TaxID=1735 RepID=UPI0022E270FA|nr:hypothetical protein [Holdemanella biformis]